LWPGGLDCRIVQWRINTQFHHTIKNMPYHLVFGMHPCVGITNLPISECVLSNLVTETELNDVICQMENNTEAATTEAVANPPLTMDKSSIVALSEATKSGTLVMLSPLQFWKCSSPESNKSRRDAAHAKQTALMEAVTPSSSLSPTPTKGKGVPLKTFGDDPT
jgi:hypothetical protein